MSRHFRGENPLVNSKPGRKAADRKAPEHGPHFGRKAADRQGFRGRRQSTGGEYIRNFGMRKSTDCDTLRKRGLYRIFPAVRTKEDFYAER